MTADRKKEQYGRTHRSTVIEAKESVMKDQIRKRGKQERETESQKKKQRQERKERDNPNLRNLKIIQL